MNDWMVELMVSRGQRYKVLAEGLENAIRGGQLGVGDRLPTHRDLARKLGISVSTVTRAYAELQERGLIEGTVGRGSFVSKGLTFDDDTSPYNTLNVANATPASALDNLYAPLLHGQGLVDLSLNYPFPETSMRCFREGMAETLRNSDMQMIAGFESPIGEYQHREAGVTWLNGLGIPARVDTTFLLSGAQGGLATILMALCRPGQTVLTEPLTWPGFTAIAGNCAVNIETVEVDEEGIDPDALDRRCGEGYPRLLYTMPTLHNPTTTTTQTDRRRAIARVARKHDLIIVEDDAYGFLLDARPASYFELLPQNTIYLASLSKAIAPSIRVAYAAAQPEMLRRLLPALRATTMAVSPLLGEIATRLIVMGLAHEAARTQAIVAIKRQQLADRLLGNRASNEAFSSMHRWVSVGPQWDSMSFVVTALRHGVSVTPASLFSPVPGIDPNAVRVCLCGEANEKRLEAALSTLGNLLRGGHVARRTL